MLNHRQLLMEADRPPTCWNELAARERWRRLDRTLQNRLLLAKLLLADKMSRGGIAFARTDTRIIVVLIGLIIFFQKRKDVI